MNEYSFPELYHFLVLAVLVSGIVLMTDLIIGAFLYAGLKFASINRLGFEWCCLVCLPVALSMKIGMILDILEVAQKLN